MTKTKKGAVLELPYGIEGFATNRNLVKEDGSNVEAGESLDFKVVEFSKEDKRILLSHTNVHSQPASRPQPAAKRKPPRKAVDKINQGTEKDTLGDLGALAALKDKMQGGGAAAAKEEEPVEKKEAKAKEKKEVKAKAEAEEKKGAKAEETKAEETPAEEVAGKAKPAAKKAAPKAKAKAKAKAEAEEKKPAAKKAFNGQEGDCD